MQRPNPAIPELQFSLTEQQLFVPGPAGKLELRWRADADPSADKVAVVCHPHPLHDGTMDNKVVTTLARTYHELGWHTVRFNFRGVGNSEGEHGYLRGEIEDLRAVLAFVRQQLPQAVIGLAGFSFGSAVVANVALSDGNIDHLVLIAPPVGKYDLDYPPAFPCPTLVVQGDQDEVVDIARTRDWAAGVQGEFHYREMPGAGHFFHGRLTELRDLVMTDLPPGRHSGAAPS
jgi:hypothetical protein